MHSKTIRLISRANADPSNTSLAKEAVRAAERERSRLSSSTGEGREEFIAHTLGTINTIRTEVIERALGSTEEHDMGFDPEFMSSSEPISYQAILERAEEMNCSPLSYLTQTRRAILFDSIADIQQTIEDFGPAIRAVRIESENGFSNALIQTLLQLPQLERLDLISPSRMNDDLSILRLFPQLSHITLDGYWHITDDNFRFIAELPHLSALDLHNCINVDLSETTMDDFERKHPRCEIV